MPEGTIDRAVFEELKLTAGADFVSELVDTFLSEAPGMLAELRRALEASEADRFRRVAHSLKSNSNTFGASELAAMARELELGGFAAARENGGEPLSALAHEYGRVAKELTELKRA
ncbi:MAG TPA: Hpt domain-containing protein [Casimicrobiaceae bacterium]|nr:Hpt domain-containing protein [Casimicrobiaceae bacterium]